MGNQRTSGLTKRGGIWHIDKQFGGVRLRKSAETSNLKEAVAFLAKRIDGIRQSLTAWDKAKRRAGIEDFRFHTFSLRSVN